MKQCDFVSLQAVQLLQQKNNSLLYALIQLLGHVNDFFVIDLRINIYMSCQRSAQSDLKQQYFTESLDEFENHLCSFF